MAWSASHPGTFRLLPDLRCHRELQGREPKHLCLWGNLISVGEIPKVGTPTAWPAALDPRS